MTYLELMDDHTVIEGLGQELLELVCCATPQADAASATLEMLAEIVRDHLAVEDPLIYQTAIAVDGGRLGALVTASIDDLAELKDCWTRYLYRWDRDHVARAWAVFGKETVTMLGQLDDRVARETAILYSLALHHGVIVPGR